MGCGCNSASARRGGGKGRVRRRTSPDPVLDDQFLFFRQSVSLPFSFLSEMSGVAGCSAIPCNSIQRECRSLSPSPLFGTQNIYLHVALCVWPLTGRERLSPAKQRITLQDNSLFNARFLTVFLVACVFVCFVCVFVLHAIV